MRKLRERRHDEQLLFGLIAATLHNRLPGPPRGVKQPGDFFSYGPASSGLPVTPEDRKALAHLMAPSKSIRA